MARRDLEITAVANNPPTGSLTGSRVPRVPTGEEFLSRLFSILALHLAIVDPSIRSLEEDVKIVVVGGVAAGMSTAARARRLDETAEIIVLERAHHVSFANCGLPYHIGETIQERDRLLLQTPESLRDALDLDVRTHHEVIDIDPEAKTVTIHNIDTDEDFQESYDKLALCPGASPFVPPLPGIDLPEVHVLRGIGDMDRIKARVDGSDGEPPIKHAVVIGAGYVGLETAENLQERGVDVEVVEMAD